MGAGSGSRRKCHDAQRQEAHLKMFPINRNPEISLIFNIKVSFYTAKLIFWVISKLRNGSILFSVEGLS